MMGDQEQQDWTKRMQQNLAAKRNANSNFSAKAEPINKNEGWEDRDLLTSIIKTSFTLCDTVVVNDTSLYLL